MALCSSWGTSSYLDKWLTEWFGAGSKDMHINLMSEGEIPGARGDRVNVVCVCSLERSSLPLTLLPHQPNKLDIQKANFGVNKVIVEKCTHPKSAEHLLVLSRGSHPFLSQHVSSAFRFIIKIRCPSSTPIPGLSQLLRDWIMPQFSTTTDVDWAVYAMSLMATMKECFHYKFVLYCGIPLVTLLGERHDWEAILERLERLKLYGIESIAWYHLLHPIISQFVAAFNAPSSPENLDFWSKVAHYEGGGSGPTYLSGWITAFCVFNEQGTWRPFLVLDGTPYPTIDDECVPCGCAHLDVKPDDNGELFDTVIVAGAVGAQICSNDKSELFRNGMRDSVRPVVGYWYFITGAG